MDVERWVNRKMQNAEEVYRESKPTELTYMVQGTNMEYKKWQLAYYFL